MSVKHRYRKRYGRAALRRASKEDLEKEANNILYGTDKEPPSIDGNRYLMPKRRMGPKSLMGELCCSVCSKPIAHGAAGKCRACYLKEAAKRRRKSGQDNLDAVVYWTDILADPGFEDKSPVKIDRVAPSPEELIIKIEEAITMQIDLLHKQYLLKWLVHRFTKGELDLKGLLLDGEIDYPDISGRVN